MSLKDDNKALKKEIEKLQEIIDDAVTDEATEGEINIPMFIASVQPHGEHATIVLRASNNVGGNATCQQLSIMVGADSDIELKDECIVSISKVAEAIEADIEADSDD